VNDIARVRAVADIIAARSANVIAEPEILIMALLDLAIRLIKEGSNSDTESAVKNLREALDAMQAAEKREQS